MSNGQLKGFAVESLIRESGADFSSKELKDVSRKNRNLAALSTFCCDGPGVTCGMATSLYLNKQA
jgi:hypothetical protein